VPEVWGESMRAKIGMHTISECNFCVFSHPLDNSLARIPIIGKYFEKYTRWICSDKPTYDFDHHAMLPNIDTIPKWCPHLAHEDKK